MAIPGLVARSLMTVNLGHLRVLLRTFFSVTLVLFVASAFWPATWRPRLRGVWLVVGLVLLLIRQHCPFLILLLPLGDDVIADHLFAYDQGAGTWFWILVHGFGYLVVMRLYVKGQRKTAVLFCLTWTLATILFLSNSHVGGEDLLWSRRGEL
ncbi:hypothetical protein ACFL09_00895 [Planctomycetota bacterium]